MHSWAVPFPYMPCQDQQDGTAQPPALDSEQIPLGIYQTNTGLENQTHDLIKIHLETTAARKEKRREQNRKAYVLQPWPDHTLTIKTMGARKLTNE